MCYDDKNKKAVILKAAVKLILIYVSLFCKNFFVRF
jgi:hypothetical protein